MKGWFEASGLDAVQNNSGPCGRKRWLSKRAAERAEKDTSRKKDKLYRYECGDHFHLTSRWQKR